MDQMDMKQYYTSSHGTENLACVEKVCKAVPSGDQGVDNGSCWVRIAACIYISSLSREAIYLCLENMLSLVEE